MNRGVGMLIAVVSGSGFPLSQLAIARFGRPGALVVGAVSAGILVADVARIAGDRPAQRDVSQDRLLLAETAVAAVATIANLALVREGGVAAAQQRGWDVGPAELVRRITLGAMFGLHATQFRTFLKVSRPLPPA